MSSHEELICTEPIYENDPWEWQNVWVVHLCDNTLILAYCASCDEIQMVLRQLGELKMLKVV